MFFQTISRNNCPNGNPFRLMLVYSAEGKIVAVYESRSSSPNQASVLRKQFIELPTFHVAPSEYNQTKRYCGVEVESTN